MHWVNACRSILRVYMRVISAGIISFHHPGSILFYQHEPLVSSCPSAKIFPQMNLKMGSYHLPSKVLGRSYPSSSPCYRHIKCSTQGRNHYQGSMSDDGFDREPFWLTVIKDITWNLRSVALFLSEQPSQLKYIEWPSIESTLKTATLTLVLVALLIVFLASVDSFLCYMLALFLRKSS